MATWTKKDGTIVNLAIGTCNRCGAVLESKRPGDYVGCDKCYCETEGEFVAAVDTDRWSPERHRFIGNVRQGPYPKREEV